MTLFVLDEQLLLDFVMRNYPIFQIWFDIIMWTVWIILINLRIANDFSHLVFYFE